MIKNKTIYFGYGDVLVGSNIFYKLTLTEIETPKEIGKPPEGEYKEIQTINLTVDYNDLKEAKRILNREINSIKIGEYILDFSNYNKKSVDVLIKHLTNALDMYMLTLAC